MKLRPKKANIRITNMWVALISLVCGRHRTTSLPAMADAKSKNLLTFGKSKVGTPGRTVYTDPFSSWPRDWSKTSTTSLGFKYLCKYQNSTSFYLKPKWAVNRYKHWHKLLPQPVRFRWHIDQTFGNFLDFLGHIPTQVFLWKKTTNWESNSTAVSFFWTVGKNLRIKNLRKIDHGKVK